MDFYERHRQLRALDPHGLRSDNQLERQIKIEDLHQRIGQLPDHPDSALEVKQILSDLVAIVELDA